VTHHWRPFLDLSPNFVVRRAHIALEPPAGVGLTFHDGVLVATAAAPVPAVWAEMAAARARTLPGVYAFSFSGAPDVATPQQAIERTILSFGNNVELTPGQGPALDKLVAALKELDQAAVRAGQHARVTVTGHTDHLGTEAHNQPLSLQRAEEVIGLLTDRGVPRVLLVPRGAGWTEPVVESPPGKEEPRNRRVTFRVTLEEAAAATRTP
jgi:outer membrane protein OmpA-like peptidoglycan-associated protein